MLRCKESAGKFKVELEVFRAKEDVHAQIMSHSDVFVYDDPMNPKFDGRQLVEEAPWVGTEKPYEGELCVHELGFLNGVPGQDFNMLWEFTVTKAE